MGFNLWKRLLVCLTLLLGCSRYRTDLEYDHPVEYAWIEPGVSGEFTLFEGVQWEPAISQSLHSVIFDQSLVANRKVLDLFCGPGVITVACAMESSSSVVSLAENRLAAACARYNVASHHQDTLVTVRLVDWNAVSVVPDSEKYDVIFGTLFSDNAEPSKPNVDRRIAILLACFNDNLELSGREIVVCENSEVADRLQSAAAEAALHLEAIGDAPTLLPVFEIKRRKLASASPVGAIPSEK